MHACAIAALTLATAGAQAITLVGLTSASAPAQSDTANTAGANTTAITGLATGDRLVGIDQRPADGKIQGVSLSSKLDDIDSSKDTLPVACTASTALNLDDGTSLATGIYRINLDTGSATLLGTYNGTLSGLTVSAVPEPQAVAMMLAGLLAVSALARRRA